VKDSGDALYTLWSFKPTGIPAGAQGETDAYLDLCAELVWDMLIQEGREKARSGAEHFGGEMYAMSYQRALPSPTHPGRNYLLAVGKRHGATQIYVAGTQIYIVAALGEAAVPSNPEAFMGSFSLGVSPPAKDDKPPAAGGEVAGTGRVEGKEAVRKDEAGEAKSGSPVDYAKPFPPRELTKRANIRSKPEPEYTEPARRFRVRGTVRLRLILAASGQVSGITPISKLPHGLTQKAVEAAQKITFDPAIKDGQRVSQYFLIEYNFNIY
jgi:TonB family protein